MTRATVSSSSPRARSVLPMTSPRAAWSIQPTTAARPGGRTMPATPTSARRPRCNCLETASSKSARVAWDTSSTAPASVTSAAVSPPITSARQPATRPSGAWRTAWSAASRPSSWDAATGCKLCRSQHRRTTSRSGGTTPPRLPANRPSWWVGVCGRSAVVEARSTSTMRPTAASWRATPSLGATTSRRHPPPTA